MARRSAGRTDRLIYGRSSSHIGSKKLAMITRITPNTSGIATVSAVREPKTDCPVLRTGSPTNNAHRSAARTISLAAAEIRSAHWQRRSPARERLMDRRSLWVGPLRMPRASISSPLEPPRSRARHALAASGPARPASAYNGPLPQPGSARCVNSMATTRRCRFGARSRIRYRASNATTERALMARSLGRERGMRGSRVQPGAGVRSGKAARRRIEAGGRAVFAAGVTSSGRAGHLGVPVRSTTRKVPPKAVMFSPSVWPGWLKAKKYSGWPK